MFTVKTDFGSYSNCVLQVGKYQHDGSLALEIFSYEEGPIARITVCLDDKNIAEDEAYVDTNNCPWAADFIEDNGLGKNTGKIRLSGYCIYPLFKFDMAKIGALAE